MDKWWESLTKETEDCRIQINISLNNEVVKSMKRILLTTLLGVVAILLSFLQPTYVADKIGLILIFAYLFHIGMLIGVYTIDQKTERVFKAKASKSKESAD